MAKNLKISIGYVLALIFLSTTLLMYFKSKDLEDSLKNNKATEVNDTLAKDESELSKIDSLLKLGTYKEALKYATTIKNQSNYSTDSKIELRIKMLEEISKLKKQNKNIAGNENRLRSKVDSVLRLKESKIDSLKLALVNTEVDVYYLEKKVDSILQEKSKKSFGEYLTFSTTKGKDLHYIGEVENGMANGFGIAILETGSRYEGEWKDNKRHGIGEFFWDDGESYKGNYKEDLREGYGVYIFQNGQKYVGQWKKDMRDGNGKFFSEDGKLIAEGLWEKDELKE
jgi:hypothetical protein